MLSRIGHADITETFVESNGVRLNVAVAGAGTPVVVLHGFPDCWQLWQAQIRALAGKGLVKVLGRVDWARLDLSTELSSVEVDTTTPVRP